MVEQLLRHAHRLSDYRLLLAAMDPVELANMMASPRCLFTGFTLDALDICKTAGEEVFRMKVYVLLLCGYNDIARIEALHATVRRIIKSRVQTRGVSMEDVSALWCLQRHRSCFVSDAARVSGKQRKRKTAEVDGACVF